ncbi:MAG: carbon-nitrogen hydrolase family protein [Clostridia bacterium]|nr:carbon-nitrogen hydrolase family protein [Clostridia bacterium]
MKDKFKIAICQMTVAEHKRKNIESAVAMIKTAAQNFAQIIILPEMFNCPYENSKFSFFAEESANGETVLAISEAAKLYGVYIVAGSIPERAHDKIYNSSIVFDRDGKILGRHRKIHLFDIHVEGKLTFRESDTLASGENITVIDTEFGKMGVAICYDIRFPELFRIMALKGAEFIVVPANFNMVTGPAHWEPLIRIRAIDNQVYIAAASAARNDQASYIAYGHSMIVDPWGNIISRADEKECIIYADVNRTEVSRIRKELPLLAHRRTDIYEVREI